MHERLAFDMPAARHASAVERWQRISNINQQHVKMHGQHEAG
jgi:hypothetical protein